MSFMNIEAKSQKKFVPREIKCPNCEEPNLKLKWHGRNSQGHNEYWDLTTQSLHLCKSKYLKTVICNRCKEPKLRFMKDPTRRSGWGLMDLKGNKHVCPTDRALSPYDKNISQMWNRIIIHDTDTEEVKQQKAELQMKLLDIQDGKTFIEREFAKMDAKQIEKNKEFAKKSTEQTFNSK